MRKIAILALVGLIGCAETTTEKDESHNTEATEVDTKIAEIKEIVEEIKPEGIQDRTTIEGFWKAYKKSIVDEDYETLEILYAEGVHAYKFSKEIPEEHELIVNSDSKNIKVSMGNFQEKEVMEYYFEFPVTEEEAEMGMEASSITVYMTKNANNEYEVFNVSLAG